MDKRTYRRILPTPAPDGSGHLNAPSVDADSKAGGKQARKLKSACHACRARKSACDGGRPACAACRQRAQQCVYPTADPFETPYTAVKREYTVLKEEFDKLYDLVDHMRFGEHDNAQDILRRIRTASNLGALHMYLDGHAFAAWPSERAAAAGYFPQVFTRQEIEFFTHHPNAYPMNSPSGGSMLARNVFLATALPRQNQSGTRSPESNRSNSTADSPSLNNSDTALNKAGEEDSWPSTRRSSTEDLPGLCDRRLCQLRISSWTAVHVTDQFAASAISFYLQTDHPLLCLFDAGLFIRDLVQCQTRYCSPFLVNSLLSFACQGYTSRDPTAAARSLEFQNEAERLWSSEKSSDTAPALAGFLLLFLSLASRGEVELGQKYLQTASQMAQRMRLFGISNSLLPRDLDSMPREDRQATLCVTWGVFNTIVLQSILYVTTPPEYPPALPFPEHHNKVDVKDKMSEPVYALSDNLYQVFAEFCKFCIIASEALLVYHPRSGPRASSLAFAVSTYQRLLSLTDTFPALLTAAEENPAQITVIHIFIHTVIVEVFRPFVRDQSVPPGSWSSAPASPDAIFKASIMQLKRLVLLYRSHYLPLCYSVFWHVGMIPLANAVLRERDDPSWRFYFMLCLGGYQELLPSFRVAEGVVQSLLMIAINSQAIDELEARLVMQEAHGRAGNDGFTEQAQGFVVDLDMAISDVEAASVGNLATRFEETLAMAEFVDKEAWQGGTT